MKVIKKFSFILALFLFGLMINQSVNAQLKPGSAYVLDKQGNIVGMVYIPEKKDLKNYVEHWILFPDYVYPGDKNFDATLTVELTRDFKYDNLADFIDDNFCEKGCRYIEVKSVEYHSYDDLKDIL
jgi:hypothetical protein